MSKELLKKSVGQKIKAIRLERGETMEKFGRNFNQNANRGLVSGWENGRYLPNPERLKKISELGNTTVDYLLNENPLSDYSTEELKAEIERRKSPHGNADLKK